MTSKLNKLGNLLSENYYLLQLKKDQVKSRRELSNIQLKRLKAIVKHAYECVPYYHRLFSSANIRPADIRGHDDLRKIPWTSKQDIQKNHLDVIQRGVDVSRFPQRFTSGSTGIPLRIVWDDPSLRFSLASKLYSFFECGVKPSDNFVTVWGGVHSTESLRPYVRLWGDIRETVVPLLPQEKLLRTLRHINPEAIHTYPSVFSSFVNYDTSGINPRSAFTQGEVLTPHCRSLVRKTFDLELFDTYGSIEFGRLAFECSEHHGLHAITSGAYIEFVDEEGEQVSAGERGEIIITGLRNRTMPLIRYRIGDEGVPTDEVCACGRSWPIIKNIYGRTVDHLVLPSGRRISLGNFYHSFHKELEKSVFSVAQFQIIQDVTDRITFKVVKGREFDPQILQTIKNSLETYFATQEGEKIEVVMQVVEEIPAGRTGKTRSWISKLD